MLIGDNTMNLNCHTSIGGNLTLVLMLILISVGSGPALAAGEPAIAPEVKRLIDEESIDAAKARYQELSQSTSLNSIVEAKGLRDLWSAYQQAGQQDAAEAVSEMMSDMTTKMMAAMMSQSMSPGTMQQMQAQARAKQQAEQQAKEQRKQKQQAEQRLREEKLAEQRGESRTDLSRFTGFYGEAGVSDLGRTIFVNESCDGYLVSGPMWADISLWWMHSDSEFAFTYAFNETNFSMEFETDSDGKVVRMRHGIDGVKSPLEWKQTLTEDWSDCVKRPY
jgi:hypothetical protein